MDEAEANMLTSTDEDKRELVARWAITALLTTQSASQIGSQESDYCDQTFERDEEGFPVLHGTTLAGALRSCLNDRLTGYRTPDEAPAADLIFGTINGPNAHQSQVIVFDSHSPVRGDTALRDGVHLDAGTRLAVNHHKYDREVALPGVPFPLRFDLLISADIEEQAALEGISLALEDLASQQTDTAVSLGARRTRGLGLCHASKFRAERYDLTCATGWVAYAESGYDADALAHLPQERECAMPRGAIETAWNKTLRPAGTDQRRRLVMEFHLALKTTLLIRSAGIGPDAPDDVHLSEAGADLLSGTAWIGALKHQTRRTLKTLAFAEHECLTLLEDLFGPDPDSGSDPRASRVVQAGEPELQEARRYRQTRTAIDRLSSAAVDSALFEEEPCVGGYLIIRLSVRQPSVQSASSNGQNIDCDAPLLLLAARDLLEGLMTLGGEASIGRGVFAGAVTATLIDPDREDEVFYMTTQEGVADEDIERFESLLVSLLKYGSRQTESAMEGKAQ